MLFLFFFKLLQTKQKKYPVMTIKNHCSMRQVSQKYLSFVFSIWRLPLGRTQEVERGCIRQQVLSNKLPDTLLTHAIQVVSLLFQKQNLEDFSVLTQFPYFGLDQSESASVSRCKTLQHGEIVNINVCLLKTFIFVNDWLKLLLSDVRWQK